MYPKGTIILIPFPFTNKESSKIRPALVLASDKEDITIAFISSKMGPKEGPFEYSLRADHPEFPSTGLKVSSSVRASKITGIDKKQVIKKIGALAPKLQKEVDARLKRFLNL